MKSILKKSALVLTATMMLASCKKFDEINNNPFAASADQVQTEYFINNSIIGAQQDPGLSERIFILYWVPGGRGQQDEDGETFSQGSFVDDWASEYYRQSSQWQNNINTAIQIGNDQIAKKTAKPYTNNLVQVARIWRAYLMSEFSDTFGPMPIDAFQGKNPDFQDVKTVYYFLLSELKDAASKLDVSVTNTSVVSSEDPAYGYDYKKWRKYANSMRMRLAMRLSQVDAVKAEAEFKDAAAGGDYITDAADMFAIQELPNSYNPLSGVFRKESSWMGLPISATYNNLSVGLGGVKSADQLGADFQSAIKPANYVGQRYTEQLATKTNDPMAGYWLDGLPNTIDPRPYKIFSIPGDISNPNYPAIGGTFTTFTGPIKDASGNTIKTLDAKYTWNAKADGNWGGKTAMMQPIVTNGCKPLTNLIYRNGTNKRVFFGPWETYFLLAEAAERGWGTSVDAKTAYETGIAKSFEYFGISDNLSTYLASTDYNRVGTSVKWDHVTEPGATHTMNYVDGVTGVAGTVAVAYPKNDLYKSGTVRNDHLTKIITQKYLAQLPYLPLETWNDHRRLGLPFFENPAVEQTMPDLPALNSSNYMTASIKFIPQRLIYPSNLKNSNSAGYKKAVSALGGPDAVLTPLWWAQH